MKETVTQHTIDEMGEKRPIKVTRYTGGAKEFAADQARQAESVPQQPADPEQLPF